MLTKSLLYLYTKIIFLFTCVILYLIKYEVIPLESWQQSETTWGKESALRSVDFTYIVISTLTFVCIFLLEYLLQQRKRYKGKLTINTFTIPVSIIGCLMLDTDTYFSLLIILCIHIIDLWLEDYFYQLLGAGILLLWILYPPSTYSALFTVAFILLFLFARITITKLQLYFQRYEEQREQVNELNKKMIDQKGMINTVKNTVSIEERNRIAARIHDQVGHGISGSIIMLEGVNLTMDRDPQKAKESLQKAITNLREGVDEIRVALREERVAPYMIGKNEIIALLQEFKASYSIDTEFKVTGDLSVITLEQWTCIHDNLKECFTNMLKHSNGQYFELAINVFQKIIKVEYRDNGKSSGEIHKGLGLEAIEERTFRCGGKCFIKMEDGFVVTNIFTYQ